MDTFKLKNFFLELLELSYQDLGPGRGNPCSELLKKMCLRQEPWLNRIQGERTNTSHEMRLNNAGLKMYWRVEKFNSRVRGTVYKFKCRIGGDQAKDYPFFVAKASRLIREYGYERG